MDSKTTTNSSYCFTNNVLHILNVFLVKSQFLTRCFLLVVCELFGRTFKSMIRCQFHQYFTHTLFVKRWWNWRLVLLTACICSSLLQWAQRGWHACKPAFSLENPIFVINSNSISDLLLVSLPLYLKFCGNGKFCGIHICSERCVYIHSLCKRLHILQCGFLTAYLGWQT